MSLRFFLLLAVWLLLGLFSISETLAQPAVVTDREIIMLCQSTACEETALRSLLPTEMFTLTIMAKDLYQIFDWDSPELRIPGTKPIFKYSAQGCVTFTEQSGGVCLEVRLNGTESNRQKLRKLKSSDRPTSFAVKMRYVQDRQLDDKTVKLLIFSEDEPK